MKKISFYKMHGLGNDFVVINALHEKINLNAQRIEELANRHNGIGFDQLLWITPSTKADVACLIFNADGSEAEQCGNGMRCIARLLHEEKIIINASTISIETKGGIVQAEINNYERIRINMGIPEIYADELTTRIESVSLAFNSLSLGNPHAVTTLSSISEIPIALWGAHIAEHPTFSAGANVGFMQIIDRHHLRLRTCERGAGETQACGSNACAAAATGILNAQLDSPVTVELAQGTLTIEWEGVNHPIFLTGPAARVFSGEFSL